MPSKRKNPSHNISTVNEKPLHAALKKWYAEAGDRFEVLVDGFLVDIVRGDLLVEIQTRGFASIRRKLTQLATEHRVRLVYPIAHEKWIVRLNPSGKGQLSRRKSPKRGAVEDVFDELVSFPRLLANANLSLEVLLIQEDEVRRHDPKRVWRRKGWVTHERRLLEVMDRRLFKTVADVGRLIPPDLAEPFSTADLAEAIGKPRRLAQRMAYCLRKMGVIKAVGKERNAILYSRKGRRRERAGKR